ncbi:MAG: ABC transporter substrate-binding protein [Holosporaceae bacterium]|jgi:putative ABC transport system substrate-binding protein|nr:ABC transporter substrate-binding protein [Holosporaceae bacterium]
MKKTVVLGALALALFYTQFKSKKNDCRKICVCKVIEHEALDAVVSGMDEYLQQHVQNCKVFVETAQGNMALALQILAKFVNSGAAVVVTVGTTPSQCAFKFAKKNKIRLIFSSVTNPEDISPDLANNNTTGVSNFVTLEPQVDLFKQIQPRLKKLGIIYNTGESNSISIINRLRVVCRNKDIVLIEQGISKIADISQATKKLVREVDAIFISNDNLALSGIPNIVAICNESKIPVYVSDTIQVEKGCLAALGPNQYDIGVQTGRIVKKVLEGEDINKIAVEYPEVNELYINLKAAELLGISIPSEVRISAKKIISE